MHGKYLTAVRPMTAASKQLQMIRHILPEKSCIDRKPLFVLYTRKCYLAQCGDTGCSQITVTLTLRQRERIYSLRT
jgi:hypothetical protein